MHTSGCTHSSPCRSNGIRANTGDAAAAGCTAENVSCQNPGRVSSSVRTAPPGRGAASSTVTGTPASARRIAAARPFGPAPMTTACALTRRQRRRAGR